MIHQGLRAIALLGVLASAGRAQGSVSVQGYGYPTGQLSAAANGGGGAVAEIDAASALNPASLAAGARYSVYMQFEPEFRTTRLGGAAEQVRVMRFPSFSATGGWGKFAAGVSFSTLLDRTWLNQYADTQSVGGIATPSTVIASSDGGITDARFSLAYAVRPRLQVGLALHAVSGQNRIDFGRTFSDSSGLGTAEQSSTLNFGGRGLSLGVIGMPIEALVVGASLRTSGPLSVRQDGRALAAANLPSRMGIGASWIGIPNTTLSVRFDKTRWTRMAALGSSRMSTFDATDIGAGLEVVGPRIAGGATALRIGIRDRGLPFGVDGSSVGERSTTGGLSIPLGRSRGQIDLGVQRATRTSSTATEKAWLLSLGLGIRP